MLSKRLLLGPPLIIALIALVWADELLQARTEIPGLLLTPLLLAAVWLAALELIPLFHAVGLRASRLGCAVAGMMGVCATALIPPSSEMISSVALVCTSGILVLLSSMVYGARHRSAEHVLGATAAAMFCFTYLGLLGGFLLLLRREHSGWVLLGVILATKSYDIGAYFTGRAIGRRKLILWLSPGKTWEGLFGGLALAGAVTTGLLAVAHANGQLLQIPLWTGPMLGIFAGLVGQAGDLVASLLKRDAGVKDYSSRLPGFGGVLDVMDSPLLVAPVAYWLLMIIAQVAPVPAPREAPLEKISAATPPVHAQSVLDSITRWEPPE